MLAGPCPSSPGPSWQQRVDRVCSSKVSGRLSRFLRGRPLVLWAFPICAWAQALLSLCPIRLPLASSSLGSLLWLAGISLCSPAVAVPQRAVLSLPGGGGAGFWPPVLRGPTGNLSPGPGLGESPLWRLVSLQASFVSSSVCSLFPRVGWGGVASGASVGPVCTFCLDLSGPWAKRSHSSC